MTTTAPPTTFSSPEVVDLAGVTYRQLDYWCRLGIIRSSAGDAAGTGSRRRFTAHDVAVIRVVGAVAGRVALNRLGSLVGFLDDLPLEQWPATSIVLDDQGDVWRPGPDAPKVGVLVDLSLAFDAR